MKICFLIHDMTARGGMERTQANLANALMASGETISVWSCFRTRSSPGFEVSSEVKLFYSRRNPLPFFLDYPWLICAFTFHVMRSRPRWVICTGANTLVVALLGILVPGVRLAVWEHFALSHSLTKARGRLTRRLASVFASRIVTLTESDAEAWTKLYAPSGTVRVIPNIVTLHPLERTPRRQEVLAMGRLVPQKGFDLLLQAWSGAVKQLPGWSLRIVGDGPTRDQLVRLADDLGIKESVTFASFSENPSILYSECGLFVLSSRFEGMPFVLVEAMICGTPCISFDCPNGPRELIHDGINGVLIPAERVDALAGAIVELGRNPAKRDQLGEAARSVSEQFSQTRVLAQWQEILRD